MLIRTLTAKMKNIFLSRRCRSKDSTRLLLEKNNNEDMMDGHDQGVNGHNVPLTQNIVKHDVPLTQNTINIQQEQHLQKREDHTSVPEMTLQELAETLHIPPAAISVRPYSSKNESISAKHREHLEQEIIALIQTSVYKHLPKPPTEIDKNLQWHLTEVQKTVLTELQRMAPLFQRHGLMGHLIKCYDHQIFKQLNSELGKINSAKSCFVLLNWLLKTYLSHDLLNHHDLMEMDPIRNIDLLPWAACITEIKTKLLELVKEDVSLSLINILHSEKQQGGCKSEDDVVEFYVDIIQCYNAMPDQAVKISSDLSHQVEEICLKELLTFVRNYKSHQVEFLKKPKKTNPRMIDFFKTLKICKEIKQNIQTKRSVRVSCQEETVSLLEDLNDFTLRFMLDIATKVTETHLKKYFKSNNENFDLMSALKNLFPKLTTCLDVQKMVLDEVYKIFTDLYMKHLISTSQKKLVKIWSRDIGQTVAEDAKLIHNTFEDLAPGVQKWNFMLLEIAEVLDSSDMNSLKLTVATMTIKCNQRSCADDLKLLPDLLRWKGLSKWKIAEIQEVVSDLRPSSSPVRLPWCHKLICGTRLACGLK